MCVYGHKIVMNSISHKSHFKGKNIWCIYNYESCLVKYSLTFYQASLKWNLPLRMVCTRCLDAVSIVWPLALSLAKPCFSSLPHRPPVFDLTPDDTVSLQLCVRTAGELAQWRYIPRSHPYIRKARNNFTVHKRDRKSHKYISQSPN